jgi:hypothetical protein
MIIQPVYHETLPAWEAVPKDPQGEDWNVVMKFLHRQDLPNELIFFLGGTKYHFANKAQRTQFLLGICAVLSS